MAGLATPPAHSSTSGLPNGAPLMRGHDVAEDRQGLDEALAVGGIGQLGGSRLVTGERLFE
jgi:hypothetical protein